MAANSLSNFTDSYGTALGAVYAVKVAYTDIQAPILTITEAIQKQSFFPKPCDDLVVGNPEGNAFYLFLKRMFQRNRRRDG